MNDDPSGNFADRLCRAVEERKSAVVVGLDPHVDLLPPHLTEGLEAGDREGLAAVIRDFCIGIVDAVHDVVPAVKPQVAFFERLGPPGYAALEEVTNRARTRGLLVVSDAKRGDIGSTARAYAEYHIGDAGETGLGADAVTVNPYLGGDSLRPFVEYTGRGKGIFVLAKTSNTGSSDLQDRDIGGQPLYDAAAGLADDVGAECIGERGYSAVGIVVGATYPAEAAALRRRHPRLLFLVPGYGAQGAGADDVAVCFDAAGLGAIVNASRSILFAYRQEPFSPRQWAEAARAAAVSMSADIAAAVARRRD